MSRKKSIRKVPGLRRLRTGPPDLEVASEPLAGLPETPARGPGETEAQPETKAPETPEPYALPGGYGETRLVALARDPEWIFVYWELSKPDRARFTAEFGEDAWESSYPVLRLFPSGGEPYDVRINDLADNWYLHVGRPATTFFIELGRVLPGGTYVALARSNPVTTPRDRISEVVDEEWFLPEAARARVFAPARAAAPSSPFPASPAPW